MSKILSIGTAVPPYAASQEIMMLLMHKMFATSKEDKRILTFLYRKSGIDKRYSVVLNSSNNVENFSLYPTIEKQEPFPTF